MLTTGLVWLIIEIPTKSKSQDAVIERIMRGKKIHLIATTGIDMTHHHKEASLLKMEVGIDIEDGIIADLNTIGPFLNSILAQTRSIVRCVVLGKISYVSAEVALQDFSDFEAKIEIGVHIKLRNGQYIFGTRLLISKDILPVEGAELEVLIQLKGKQTYGITALTHMNIIVQTVIIFPYLITQSEVCVIGNLVEGNTQFGFGLFPTEHTLNARMDDLRQAIIIP